MGVGSCGVRQMGVPLAASQTVTVRSAAAARRLPSGLKRGPHRGRAGAVIVTGFPPPTGQARIVLSAKAAATRAPSGLIVTPTAARLGPASTGRGTPVSSDQVLTEPSTAPETTRRPSGL